MAQETPEILKPEDHRKQASWLPWILWFALMPLPFPGYNLLLYYDVFVLAPAEISSAAVTDFDFKIERYIKWKLWVLAAIIALFNLYVLRKVVRYHAQTRAEGGDASSAITCGAAVLMLVAFSAVFIASIALKP